MFLAPLLRLRLVCSLDLFLTPLFYCIDLHVYFCDNTMLFCHCGCTIWFEVRYHDVSFQPYSFCLGLRWLVRVYCVSIQVLGLFSLYGECCWDFDENGTGFGNKATLTASVWLAYGQRSTSLVSASPSFFEALYICLHRFTPFCLAFCLHIFDTCISYFCVAVTRNT
jgi:hypothetical protein